jgi:glycosyltransferase involved in cell wall biosynthesis
MRGEDKAALKRVIVISEDLREPWDEGIKKFAWSVGNALRGNNDVRILNVDRSGMGETAGGSGDGAPLNLPGTRTFATRSLKNAIQSFDPEVVLYVPSPSSTISSFARSFFLRRHAPQARHGMVALIPRRHRAAFRPFLNGTAPDIVFVPSRQSLLHLHQHSLRGEVIPVGVDTSLFRPPQSGERNKLRQKYDVPADAYLYLHIGHLSPKRNLFRLAALKELPRSEVLVIGSTSTPEDENLRDQLESAGVSVIRRHVPVEEFYRMADCYVFPVEDHEGCVEIPLSVFEALASGLPVLSTTFGGLQDFAQPGADLRYFGSDAELPAFAAAMRENGAPEVRSMDEFSWLNVAEQILGKLTK